MAVKKLSISLDERTLERARRAANVEGIPLSTWLTHAAEDAAAFAEAKAELAEYMEIYGEPDPALMDQTREELAGLGFGRPETNEERAARLAALARLSGQLPAETGYRAAG